ncbi:MAG: hypothetical protein M3Y57_08195 [Acidobacteriota bacterium]|nr:hypothetical protein [Acidobacteriota bacterium]
MGTRVGSQPSDLIEVECPCCGSTLRIDPETRVVLQHKEPEKKPLIDDLRVAAQALKGEADRRNDVFEKSFASHLNADKVRERKFEELLKQAKEDKSGAPPKRLFDLD